MSDYEIGDERIMLYAGVFAGVEFSEEPWIDKGELVLRWNARAAVTDEQFSLAVHDGRVWHVARTCGEYRGNVYETTDGTSDDIELWCEHCDIPLEDGWRHCPNCGAKVTR